ncbi:protein RAE1 [Tanacetum coccineum]|uniref:Protein RAE1 n=1 Tax=Tanacetum coccineum TaxID=301880 RepID=A0ABQ5IA97_9ASTR
MKEGSGLAGIGLSKTILIDIEFRRLQARDMLWTGPISNTYVEVVQCEISVEFCDIEGCYALSVKHPLIVVRTADKNLTAFNFLNQFKRITSLLKYQTRCVATFPDQQGFLVQHTFATPGSDGAFNFWDKDSKQRLKIKKPSKKDTVSCTGLDEPSSRKRNQRNKPRENRNIVYTEDEYEDEDEYVDGDEVADEDDHVGS